MANLTIRFATQHTGEIKRSRARRGQKGGKPCGLAAEKRPQQSKEDQS